MGFHFFFQQYKKLQSTFPLSLPFLSFSLFHFFFQQKKSTVKFSSQQKSTVKFSSLSSISFCLSLSSLSFCLSLSLPFLSLSLSSISLNDRFHEDRNSILPGQNMNSRGIF